MKSDRSIDLHQRPRGQLLFAIEKFLRECAVVDGVCPEMTQVFGFDEHTDSIVAKLPAVEQLKIRGWIEEQHPFGAFLYSEVRVMLEEAGHTLDRSVAPFQLTDLADFADVTAVAEKLVSRIESMPQEYCFRMRFSDEMCARFLAGNVEPIIGDRMAIAGNWQDLGPRFPPLNAAADLESPSAIPKAALYLLIRLDGYVADYFQTETETTLDTMLRSFLGLAIAMKALATSDFLHGEVNADAEMWKNLPEGWRRATAVNPVTYVSRQVWSNCNWASDFRSSMDSLRAVVSLFGDTPSTASIRLAAAWYFESLGTFDTKMKYMQLAIVTEVLLGSEASAGIGITKLLANRCAYSLAESTSERQQLIKQFHEIYSLRSAIVHGGTFRLKRHELALLEVLRSICGRLITKEVRLQISNLQGLVA